MDRASARMMHVRNDAVGQIVLADNALRTTLAAYDASQGVATATLTKFDAALAAYRSGVGSITAVRLPTLALSTGIIGAAPL